ncbi:MAG: hypothetical protein R3C55_05215 [Parvularculaceae bacterium]
MSEAIAGIMPCVISVSRSARLPAIVKPAKGAADASISTPFISDAATLRMSTPPVRNGQANLEVGILINERRGVKPYASISEFRLHADFIGMNVFGIESWREAEGIKPAAFESLAVTRI